MVGKKQQPIKKRKATTKGEAEKKITGYLLTHHKYDNGTCENYEPLRVGEIVRGAEIARGSVPDFFNKYFADGNKGGHNLYKTACHDQTLLNTAMRILAGEFSPSILFHSTPIDLVANGASVKNDNDDDS